MMLYKNMKVFILQPQQTRLAYIYIYVYSCTTTNHPSQKLSKLEEPDMHDSAGEVGTSP